MMVRWWLESCVKRVSSQTSSYLTLSNQYISRQCTHYSCPWIAAKWLVLCQDACRSLKQIYSEYYPTLHRCLLKHMHYIRLGCWVSKVNLGKSKSQPIALLAIMIMTTMISIMSWPLTITTTITRFRPGADDNQALFACEAHHPALQVASQHQTTHLKS